MNMEFNNRKYAKLLRYNDRIVNILLLLKQIRNVWMSRNHLYELVEWINNIM